MRFHIGTSGYSYKEWKGTFYPDKLPAAQMLSYYAERFKTVEINNTFYRMPDEATLRKWAGEVPADFRFALKAFNQITHVKRLKDAGDAVARLAEAAAVLGKKLGPLLFQLPPNSKKDLALLQNFLAVLPGNRRAAMEFRHESWFDAEVYDALRAAKVALCVADTDDELQVPFVATAPWGYLRLRRAAYGDAKLRAWVKRIRAQSWSEAFVFFKHEDEGKGPKFAARFMELSA